MDFLGGQDVEETGSSVGEAFRSKQVLTMAHPDYKAFSEGVIEELTKVSERVAAQRSTARRVMLTIGLDPEQLALLAELYPEFVPVVIPLNRPVHSFWNASRVLAFEWCAVMTQKYAKTCISYGGSLLHALARRDRLHHVEHDATDDVMLHEAHCVDVDMHRLFEDYAAVQSTYGVVLPRNEYEDYLRGRAYHSCSKPDLCTVQAQAMCVDLTVSAMSPTQVAMGMLQHGAEICHGFLAYHPMMLVQDEGELPGTGVWFSRDSKTFSFSYPEGRSGVTSYSRASYACWLTAHTFCVGSGAGIWFQLELMKNRGSLMFFRLARVDAQPSSATFRHALDLPSDDEYTLVDSWKLKRGFASDVTKASEWQKHSFLARTRIVRRVSEFAMQLQPDKFTRFAIKKQIRVVNNRWVVHGTTVNVSAPLDNREVEALTTAIYSRAFVDRYESSQLSSEMMSALKRMTAFHSASMSERVMAIARAAVRYSMLTSFGKVDSALRGFSDWLLSVFITSPRLDTVGLMPAPTYVSLASATGTWRAKFLPQGEQLYSMINHGFVYPLAEGVTGFTMANLAKKYGITRRHKSQYTIEREMDTVVRVMTSCEDVRLDEEVDTSAFVDAVRGLNEMDQASERRYNLEYERTMRTASEIVQDFKTAEDPDPVNSLNSLYLELFPAVANQRVEHDSFSLSLDPQDRVLSAIHLRMPTYFGPPPQPREYYASKLNALNVPKRQQTNDEQLTAIAARNLNAPVISLPQEEDVVIRDIWDRFLDVACVGNAREKLADYQSDPVALAEDALSDWGKKAKPGVVDSIVKELERNSKAMGEMPVDEYLAMLKADVKPTLSTKPVGEVTAPQVIVYHEKPISAFFSSIFRVIVRRFLSLLKPNIHVNLLKDSADIAAFITDNHPFGNDKNVKYMENDYSKYDKSQSRFAFILEEFVFKQLGMNADMLQKWVHGHVDCSIRSVATGLSLHVMYQRKSGDATTALGNVILNILSVFYAYNPSKTLWAVFMGDDSILCATAVGVDTDAVQILAEIFNLTAKCYITEAPYFSSNFILIDSERMQVKLCPDPVKRIERLSMHVSADDPQWKERHASFVDSMSAFNDESVVQKMATMVPLRYEASEGLVRGAVSALGTLARSFTAFRAMWEARPILLQA